MAVPSYTKLLQPVLECIGKHDEIKLAAVIDCAANKLEVCDEDRKEKLSNGWETVLYNRTSWAISYLKQAALVVSHKRGHYSITDRGRKALTDDAKIDQKYLEQFKEFQDFKARWSKKSDSKITGTKRLNSSTTPTDDILASHSQITSKLSEELLDIVIAKPFDFLERLIVELLAKMNYGVSGEVIGKTSDQGVDGVINQDELGVEKIYVQAKRYQRDNRIGSTSIRDFSGALKLKQCEKGIFFTTSFFSRNAQESAEKLGIVLIDGTRLAGLMIKHNVGCYVDKTLHIKKTDADFFMDE